MFGSAGMPTRPAGYTGDGSRAASGTPPAASRPLHSLSLAHTGDPRRLTFFLKAAGALSGLSFPGAASATRVLSGHTLHGTRYTTELFTTPCFTIELRGSRIWCLKLVAAETR